jgi:hypothetical protein
MRLLAVAFVFHLWAEGRTGMASEEPDTREIRIELTVPDTAWSIRIEDVYRVADELWAISRLHRSPDAIGLTVITTVSNAVAVQAGPLPVKHFVLGKTWRWRNDEPYTFLESLDPIRKALEGAEPIRPLRRPREE